MAARATHLPCRRASGRTRRPGIYPVFFIPGEHDTSYDGGAAFWERFGRGKRGGGWYSFDHKGVHFIGLNNVVMLDAFGDLGPQQLEWMKNDTAGLSASTPIIVFAHVPLWMVYPEWGWGTSDGAQALSLLKRFGSVTVLNGHIHQVVQKVEGNVSFHTAMSTAFPQPAPGTAPHAAACRLKPSMSAHMGCRGAVSCGIAPRKVSIFCRRGAEGNAVGNGGHLQWPQCAPRFRRWRS